MPVDDSDVTPVSVRQGGGGTHLVTPRADRQLVDAMRAAGGTESLPMRLALARTRSQLFDLRPTPTRLGRFELLDVIGRGATAAVHTARDPRLDRVVALKVFSRGLDAATSARVMREAGLAASFNHPNVVTVLDVGESDGRIWVAMERVEGQTLREVLRSAPADWAVLAPLFLPVALGLQEVHRQGIVHRDVKPENILVDPAGRVVLTDFGVATRGPIDSEAGAGGTPAYMSPEQLDGGRVGPASDQFSYCVTLFEAFEGTRPVAAESVTARLEAIRAGPEAALSNASMPSTVRSVLARGLALDPKARFASMAELAAALGHRGPRRWVPVLGAVAALLAVGSLSGWAEAPETCAEDARSARRAWTSVRDEVGAAFATGSEPFVIDGGPRVLANVDRYVEDLAGTRVAVCEAAKRHSLTAKSASVRARCLGRRQHELEQFIATLDDAQARKDAIAGSYELARIEACLDGDETTVVPDHLRAEVEAFEVDLDALRDSEGTGSSERRLDQAAALFARAHALGHRPVLIRALTALGNARKTAGDAQGALEAWEEAYFSARREAMPVRSLELATAVVGALATLGRFDDARAWVRHARGAKGRAPGSLTASRVDYTEATVLLMLERPEEALPLFTKVLQTRSTVLGDDHPTVADAHLEIGNAYLAMGEFDRALDELRIARRIHEVAFGPRHPSLSIIDNNLGAVQFRLGRVDVAAQHWVQSLSIGAAALGERHISAHGTLTNLAKASATQGAWEDAEVYVGRALRVWDAAGLGDRHSELVGTLEVQGEILLQREAAGDAYRAYAQAIEICDEVYGTVEIPTLGPLAGAARAAWALDDATAAVRHAQRFLDSPDARLFSPQTYTGIVWLHAQALWETGHHPESRRAAERALDSYREMEDEEATRQIAQWLSAHEV